jgi:hypothetical protein
MIGKTGSRRNGCRRNGVGEMVSRRNGE